MHMVGGILYMGHLRFYICIFSISFCFFLHVTSSTLQDDEQALLELKNSLQMLSPDVLSNLSDWTSNTSTSVCSWSRVSCSVYNGNISLANTHVALDISQNNNSRNRYSYRVTGLNLSFLSLSGSIRDGAAASIARLTALAYLNISYNLLNSSIPLSDLTNCTNLQVLDLSHNQFTGYIPPDFISSFTSLANLSIASNQLLGSIPPFLCNSLLHLDLSDNHLTGNFPLSLTTCLLLQHLDLSGNNLTGSILSQVGNLTDLHVLNLSENMFDGIIPPEIGSLTNLRVFMAGTNRLNGSIPAELWKCKLLILLDISYNNLEGKIPEFDDDMVSLTYFVLHSNVFEGTIPSSLFIHMPAIELLDLSNNSLFGPLPSGLTNLSSSLELLLLADNHFTGEIPPELGQLTRLQILDLSSNNLQGSIPSSFGKLQNLLWLMLAYNGLTGQIPKDLGNCTSLLWLNLKSNSLTGELPKELAMMGRDPHPVFKYNAKHINPPAALGECFMIKRWIPENYPPYSFHYDLLNKPRCKYLWINLLTGSTLISSCRRLPAYIQVTDNKLSGPIPENLQANRMSTLLLSLNSFNSTLPTSLGKAPLVYLNVSHNNITGSIPESLANNTCLTLLDLSFNNLSGSIPSSLGDLYQLSIFNASYNPLLTGGIPFTGQFLTFTRASYFGDPLLCYDIAPGTRTINYSTTTLRFCNGSGGNVSEQAVLNTTNRYNSKFFIGIGVLIASLMILCAGLGSYYMLRMWPYYNINDHLEDTFSDVFSKDESHSDPNTCGSRKIVHSTVCVFKRESLSLQSYPQQQLTYKDIIVATNNFSEANVIGHGGFGTVYKGELRDGTKVAIKKLSHHGPQGDREFMAEMETLGTLQQENLVPLLGCCKFGSEKLLIYKFIRNGSLEDWLYTRPGGAEELTWMKRLKIAWSCAKALSYLHHLCSPVLIHRDMKASNILLDEDFNAYVADFGLARMIDPKCTHVSTAIAGTLGYVPPEYCHTWRATTKGDVYSFGVVLLELLTGKKPILNSPSPTNLNGQQTIHKPSDQPFLNPSYSYSGTLVDWVRSLSHKSRTFEAFYHIRNNSCDGVDEKVLNAFLEIALACTSELPEQRPSMGEVVSSLDHLLFHHGAHKTS